MLLQWARTEGSSAYIVGSLVLVVPSASDDTEMCNDRRRGSAKSVIVKVGW
jgi:hypothetical protein